MMKESALNSVLDAIEILGKCAQSKTFIRDLKKIAERLEEDITTTDSELFDLCKSTAELQKKMRGE